MNLLWSYCGDDILGVMLLLSLVIRTNGNILNHPCKTNNSLVTFFHYKLVRDKREAHKLGYWTVEQITDVPTEQHSSDILEKRERYQYKHTDQNIEERYTDQKDVISIGSCLASLCVCKCAKSSTLTLPQLTWACSPWKLCIVCTTKQHSFDIFFLSKAFFPLSILTLFLVKKLQTILVKRKFFLLLTNFCSKRLLSLLMIIFW